MNKTLLWIIIVVIVVVIAWYFFFRGGATVEAPAVGIPEVPALDAGVLTEEAAETEDEE